MTYTFILHKNNFKPNGREYQTPRESALGPWPAQNISFVTPNYFLALNTVKFVFYFADT